MEKINISSKNTELVSILKTQFNGQINLARIKLIAMFITALCKVQTVNFEKLANAFDAKTQSSSNLRRIQRFIACYILDSDLIAKIIFSLLPEKENLKLSIDRTNWQFGQTNINIFMLGVCYQGIAFPLMFKMLPKKGNSNTQERIDVVERFIRLFGSACIDCILADREFVGNQWLGYLNSRHLRYYIRIRNNFKIFIPYKNQLVRASWLFNTLKTNECMHYHKIVKIGTEFCFLSGSKIKGKDGTLEFLIIASFNKPDQALLQYKERWQIETCFKAIKSSGFDIEKTHLQEIQRIEKLILFFVWCYKVGIYLHQNIKPIEIKSHGREAKSIFKYGLNYIACALLNANFQGNINVFNFLSCT